MRLGEFLTALGQFFLSLASGTCERQKSISGVQDSATERFLLAEYQDLYQNVIHLENKLFSHLSFFTTLFLGIVTASIAILQLVDDTGSPVDMPQVLLPLSFLFFVFLIVGRFELRMTLELRARKVKFVEGITQIRQYFAERDPSVLCYLVLPVGLKKAPPYLRVRSKDWYQMLFISFIDGLAAFIICICLLYFLKIQMNQWNLPALVLEVFRYAWIPLAITVGFLVSLAFYNMAMRFCRYYDIDREAAIGEESEYDLFDRTLPESKLRWTLGDLMWWLEKRRTAKDKGNV